MADAQQLQVQNGEQWSQLSWLVELWEMGAEAQLSFSGISVHGNAVSTSMKKEKNRAISLIIEFVRPQK